MNRIIKMDYLGICNNEQVRGLLSYTVDYNKWTDDVERSVIMKDLFKKLQTELELKKLFCMQFILDIVIVIKYIIIKRSV